MNINRLSPSSYGRWEFCQHAYFLEQNLKYRYPAGKAAQIGTVAHRALELLSLIKLQEQNGIVSDFLTLEGDKNVEADSSKKLDIKNYTVDGLTDYAIKDYDHDFFTNADIRNIKKYVNYAISWNDGMYDPRNRNIVATERRVKVELQEDWALLPDGNQFHLSGIIDLVTQVDDNTYEIIDWKSGRTTDFNTGKEKGYAEFCDDPQLRFYHLAATEMYGIDKNFNITIFFIKVKECHTVAFTPSDLDRTKLLLKNRFEEISRSQEPELNRSWKCQKFCPFGKLTTKDTNFPILTQMEAGGIARKGQDMTICDCSITQIKKYGLDYVEQNMSRYIDGEK